MALKYDLPYEVSKAKGNSQDEYNKVMGERYDIAQRILEGIRDIYSWAKKDIQTFVVQLAGEEGGNYLPSSRDAANKGYSASLFDNPASADAGQHWVDAMVQQLTQMKECQ